MNVRRKSIKTRLKKNWPNILAFIFLALHAALNISLVVYMLLCSFQSADSEIFAIPPRIIPRMWRLRNYLEAFEAMNYWNALKNTLIIMVCSNALCFVSTMLIAYGFARFNAKGKNVMFMLLISTMMLPWVVTMIPAFVMFKYIGWINTKLPLIIPSIGGSAFYIFLFRQYIMGIPRSLDEAAKIDGAGTLRILVSVIMPNLRSIIAYMLIMSITGSYSDFLGPSIYLIRARDYTIALALRTIKSGYGVTNWKLSMAGSVIYSLPLIIVFLAGQKEILKGLSITGLK